MKELPKVSSPDSELLKVSQELEKLKNTLAEYEEESKLLRQQADEESKARGRRN